MNRTFKVAKSLTRGVVVTSEKASSYQGKAVKTVIAAAVSALVAGVAMAGETTAASTEWKDKTINQDVTVSADTKLISATLETGTITLDANIDYDHTNDQGTFNMKGGKIVNSSKTLQVMDFTMTGGSIEAVGADGFVDSTSRTIPNVGSTNTFVMEAGEISLKNGGRIWIGSSWWKDPSHYNRMELKGGTINMQGQGYITGLNRYIAPGEYYGGENQPEKVVITQDTLAHNVLGLDGVNLNIAGKGNIIDFVAIELTAGKLAVAEGGELTFRATTATNETNTSKAEELIAQKSSIVVKGGEISNQGTIDATKIANFAVEGGMVTNAGTLAAKTVTIKSGTVDNTGTLTADTLAIQGGTVNTVAGAKYAVTTTSLEKNGTLNLTALNSNQFTSLNGGPEAGKTQDDYANDQFLVYGTLNLNGGALLANGEALQKMKVGSGSTAATVNVNSDFAIADLAFGTKGTVKVAEDATLTVNDLYLTVNKDSDNKAVTSIKNDGTVVVTGDVTTPKGLAVSDMQDAVFVNNGTVYTNIDNVVTLTTADGKISAAAITAFGSILNDDSGNVYESADRTLTLTEYNKIAAAMGKLTMLNTVVTSDTAGEDLKFSDVATNGLNSPATTVRAAATDKAVTLTPSAAVLVANVKTDAETVTIDGSTAGVTLAGKDGVLFGTGVKKVTVKGTNGLTLGYEAAEKTGSIAGEVTVEANSKLAVEAGSFTIAGIASAGTLAIDGGDLTTSYLTGSATITDGILAVLGNKAATTATGKAAPAADSVNPFANAVKVDQITFNGTADNKDTGVLAVGADAQTAEAAVLSVYDAHELAGKNIVYLTKQAVFSAEPSQATDYLIDVAQVAASEGFTAEAGVLGNQLSSTGLKVKLANVTAAALEGEAGQKTLRVAQTGSTATAKVDFGNWFYGEKDYESTVTNGLVDGVITFSPNKDKIKQIEKLNVAALAKDAADNVTFGQNEIVDELAFKTVAYNEAVTDRADELGLTGEEHSKYIASAMDTYFDQLDIASELAIAGGVFGTTLDINDQVTAALDRRTSLANLNAPRTEGFTPWVDVFGTKNEAKRIYGEGAGYEADIYGAVLGFDYTAACGGVFGLAFNVGQADGNSVGIGSAKVENDADFYGVSLYAAQTFGDFNVKADLGYTQVKNDLKMNGVTKTWKESQDADVITFGVGTEYLVKAGALNVVPHAGIRMTRIDLDDSKYGAEYETMTVYQMPLGVAFSGTFDTNGWKVAPMVDVSVVPTFGDKDAEAKYFGGVKDVVRVVDSNPIRATLGVEAQTGAWTFGVNYGLTAGSDDRLNNSFNANARYTF